MIENERFVEHFCFYTLEKIKLLRGPKMIKNIYFRSPAFFLFGDFGIFYS
jgi:hypothetical protein